MAELLTAASQIPISQLTPDLSEPSSRYIRAIVTLIWPYSSSNSTFKVLLAEPDFRLRRTKGQVRVQFSGSSAKTVFDAGIGSGDELILSLEGVEWTKDESVGQTPGRSIDWELKFSERLVLKIQQDGSEKTTLLNIDHPIRITEPEVLRDIPESEPIISSPKSTAFNSGRPGLIRSETNEWPSPAFVKRARVSYGSLLESGYDIFAEEDGTIQGRGRKRTRFSRQSGGWRYSSRSQSPESSPIDETMTDLGPFEPDGNQKPAMTDEGCQTLGSREDNAAEALADLSGQQTSAILSDDGPNVYQPGGNKLTESLSRPASSTDVLPQPITLVTLDGEIRGANAAQEPPAEARQNSVEYAQIGMAHLDNIHGVTPNETSEQDLGEATEPTAVVEVEDLYGLSPTAEDRPRNETSGLAKDPTGPLHDDTQVEFRNDQQDDSESLENHKIQMNYPKLLDLSTSPDEVGEITAQIYPELAAEINHRISSSTSPYSGDQSQNYLGIHGDELYQQSNQQWDMHIEDVRRSEDRLIPDQVPIQKMPARLFSPAGIAMSRSHSGSEMIDLTEDSDENEGEANESLQTDDEQETDERPYQLDDMSGEEEEEEGYENLLYDEHESESAENQFNYDENTIRRPIKNIAPGEVADDEDGLDSEGHYSDEEGFDEEDLEEDEEEYDEDEDEDEDVSEEEGVSHAIKQPRRDEPEVIDLLSSDGEEDGEDGEDGEDPNASTADSESEEGAAMNLDQNSSISIGEQMSEGDTETDIEEFDDKAIEGAKSNEEHLQGTRPSQFKLAEGGKDEESERSISDLGSDEDEVEVSSRTNRHVASQVISPAVMGGSKDFQVGSFDRGNNESATGDKHATYGGYDGTVDGSDYLEPASREAEKDKPALLRTSDKTSTDPIVTYPVLPVVDTIAEIPPLFAERSAEVEDSSKMLDNEQLPTPDATQLTEPMALDTSFGLVDSFHSPSGRAGPLRSDVNNMESSPHIETSDAVQKDDELAAVTELVTSSPRDVVIESATDAVEMITEAVAGDAARDTSIDHAIEVISGKAPETALNSTVEVAEKALVEVVQPKPVTPRRSKRLSFTHQEKIVEKSPSINIDEPTTPEDYDASVELAMAALDSPSAQSSDKHLISEKEMRIKLSRPLRTDYGDFTTLKLIRFNLERKLDVLALVTTLPSEPQRAKAGLRHYHLRFNITDSTIAPSSVVAVNVFRPYKMALPVVQPGDVLLLRNFLVKSDKGAGFALRSDEGSSWVVFKASGEEQIKGPPVEYGDAERNHVSYLKLWYKNLDSNFLERLEKANGVIGSDMERSVSKAF